MEMNSLIFIDYIFKPLNLALTFICLKKQYFQDINYLGICNVCY